MVYSTYSNSSAFIVSDDIIVSEIKVEGGKLKVSNYATGAIVPANTGVMVSALEGGNYTIQLTTGGTSLLGDNNMLKPSGDTGINAANMNVSDTKFYRLTMHNSTQIGFYWGAENGAAFDIAANKAYLAVPNTEAGARIGLWFGDDATGIANLSSGSSMNVNDSLNKVYDLQGRRVAHLGNGMYIINGKKFINK